MTNVFDKVRFSRGVKPGTDEIEWKLEADDRVGAFHSAYRMPGPHAKMNREELQQLHDVIASDLREHEA